MSLVCLKASPFFRSNVLFSDGHYIKHKCLMMAEGQPCQSAMLEQNLKFAENRSDVFSSKAL